MGVYLFSRVNTQFLEHKQHKWQQRLRTSEGTLHVGSRSETMTQLVRTLKKYYLNTWSDCSHPLSSPLMGSGKRERERERGEEKFKERRVERSQRGNVSPCLFADFRDSLVDFWDLWRRAAEPGRTIPKSRRTGKKTPLLGLCVDLGSSDGPRWGEGGRGSGGLRAEVGVFRWRRKSSAAVSKLANSPKQTGERQRCPKPHPHFLVSSQTRSAWVVN